MSKIVPVRGPATQIAPGVSTAPMDIDRSQILGSDGKPLRYGNEDPNVYGPDDNPPAVRNDGKPLRDRSHYPAYMPPALFEAEERYVLPFAIYVASDLVRTNLYDDLTYQKVLRQLKQQNIFTVLDITKPVIDDRGVIRWAGLKIWCKEVPVAAVTFRHDPQSRVTIIPSFTFWENRHNGFHTYGNPDGLEDIGRERMAEIIGQYLYVSERILS